MNKFKLFFLRYKDRIIRFLISFSVLSSLVLSSFTVGAVSSVWFLCDKPQVTDNSAYVEVVDGSGTAYVFYLFGVSPDNSTNTDINYSFYCTTDSSGYLYFKTDLRSTMSGYSCHSFYITQGNQTVATPYWVEDGYSYIRLSSINYIMGYNCDVSSVKTAYNDYCFYYSGDVIISDKLTTISNILTSVNNNISSQSAITRDKLNEILTYTVYCNSNLEKVNKTLSSILSDTNDINVKLDSILQILQAAENGVYYNPADDGTQSTVTNQQQKDDEVMQGTSTGRTEANNAISGLSGLLTTTGSVWKGSLALTKVFNLFAQSSFLVPILQLSLVLGIASFVLGTSVLSLGHFAHNSRPSRNNKKNNSDEE